MESLGESSQGTPDVFDGEQMANEKSEEHVDATLVEKIEDENFEHLLSPLSPDSIKMKRPKESDEQEVSSQPIEMNLSIINPESIDESEVVDRCERVGSSFEAGDEVGTDLAREEGTLGIMKRTAKPPKKHLSLRAYALKLRRAKETPEQREKRMASIARIKRRQIETKKMKKLLMISSEGKTILGAREILGKRASRLAAEAFFKTFQKVKRPYKLTADRNRTLRIQDKAEIEGDRCVKSISSGESSQQIMSWEAQQESVKLSVRNWCAEFDEILSRRAIVVLERCALPPSFVFSPRPSETNDENGVALEERVSAEVTGDRSQLGLGWKKRAGGGERGRKRDTAEEREARHTARRFADKQHRESETPEELKKRLEYYRIRRERRKERETSRDRWRRRRMNRLYWMKTKANETEEQLEKRVANMKKFQELQLISRLDLERAEKRRVLRNERRRKAWKLARARETQEQREKRLLAGRLARARKFSRQNMEERYGQIYEYVENDEDEEIEPARTENVIETVADDADEMDIDFEAYGVNKGGVKMEPEWNNN